jgi:hypothetical protein
MMKTPAWQNLSCVARCLYIEIERRYGGPGSNNGKIHYSVREGAHDLNISKTTAAKGFAELQDRGFIQAVTMGAFSRKNRHATEWRLTAHGSDISQDFATKEYERWQPASDQAENQNTVPQRGLTVPHRGPNGPSRRTVAA